MIRIRLPLPSALPLFLAWPEDPVEDSPEGTAPFRREAASTQGDRLAHPSGLA